MPNPRNDSLSADQKALASDPRSLEIAASIAGRYARTFPRLADELRSEALLALCSAARTFEPHRQVSFPTHATYRIEGAMFDLLRGLTPWGYRRRDRADAPHVGSLEAIQARDNEGRPLFLRDVLAADELPVGWEAEYQDELAGLTSSLSCHDRTVLRLLYGHAETKRMRITGLAVGLSEARVSQIHAKALSLMEEAATRAGERRRRA